jgi:Na+/proline symporter
MTNALIWAGRIASLVMFAFAIILALEVSNALLLMERDAKSITGILAGVLAGLGLLTLIVSQILAEVSGRNNG